MRQADRQMKYRFSAAIFVRGDHAFIEIPFNVREEAGGQTRNFGRLTVRGRARPAPKGRAPRRRRRVEAARPETRARGKCSVC